MTLSKNCVSELGFCLNAGCIPAKRLGEPLGDLTDQFVIDETAEGQICAANKYVHRVSQLLMLSEP